MTIPKLHPTLRACKCGFIGSRNALYAHLSNEQTLHRVRDSHNPVGFYNLHGEVILNENDPRLTNQ